MFFQIALNIYKVNCYFYIGDESGIAEGERVSYTMDTMAMLLKPVPFKVKKKGDPEQLLQDFVEYMELFEQFITATNVAGEHTDRHLACQACTKSKAMLVLIGGVPCSKRWGKCAEPPKPPKLS